MTSYSNHKLNANEQKKIHDHIIYYDKWNWVKPCLNYSIYGILIILSIYWFVFAIIALINNPPAKINAICSNTGLNVLLISQIIWFSFVILERLFSYYYNNTNPPIICTLCVSSWCLCIWCFGALWGKCSKQKLTTLDVYKSVLSWFIIYITIISILFIRCCIYKQIKRICFNNRSAIINLEPPMQQYKASSYIRTTSTTSYCRNPNDHLSQKPLSQVQIPEEPINYAEL